MKKLLKRLPMAMALVLALVFSFSSTMFAVEVSHDDLILLEQKETYCVDISSMGILDPVEIEFDRGLIFDESSRDISPPEIPNFDTSANELNQFVISANEPNLFDVSADKLNRIDDFAAIDATSSSFPFNTWLQGMATNQVQWLSFDVVADRKLTIALHYLSGIYDLYLFNSNSVLIASSIRGNGFELINYISASGGTYTLAIAPFIPAPTPILFDFIVYNIHNFDQYELNETAGSGSLFTNSMNIHANIDNPWDEDWFRLNVANSGWKRIDVHNASHEQYAVFVLRTVGTHTHTHAGFLADGDARFVHLPAGNYDVVVLSFTGHFNANQNYNLVITPLSVVHSVSSVTYSGPDAGYVTMFQGTHMRVGRNVTISGNAHGTGSLTVTIVNLGWRNFNLSMTYATRIVTTNNGRFSATISNHPLRRQFSWPAHPFPIPYDLGLVRIYNEVGELLYQRSIYIV